MNAPEGPRLRLDGVAPLGLAAPGEPALGRDPFAGEPRDPLGEALSLLSTPRPRPHPGRDATQPRGLLERWMGSEVLGRLATLEEEAERAARDPGFSPAALRTAMPPFLASHGRTIPSASSAGTSFHVSAVNPTAGLGSTTSSGPFLPRASFHDASRTLLPSCFLISMLTSGWS